MSKVFIASPLGFSLPGRTFLVRTLHPALKGNGFDVLDQWGVQPERLTPQQTDDGVDVADRNLQLLLQADVLLAVLDGPDVDSGTAAEIGFASAAGTPVVGYRSDERAGAVLDASANVNKQVVYLLQRSGGLIVGSLDAALLVLRDLAER